jgi:hypothetical protein
MQADARQPCLRQQPMEGTSHPVPVDRPTQCVREHQVAIDPGRAGQKTLAELSRPQLM